MLLIRLCCSLLYLSWVGLGVVIAFCSPDVLTILPTWLWQATIGFAAMVSALVVYQNLRGRSGEAEVLAGFSFVAGVAVVLAFNTYEQVLARMGLWPLWLAGAVIGLNGLNLFINDLVRDEGSLAERLLMRRRTIA